MYAAGPRPVPRRPAASGTSRPGGAGVMRPAQVNVAVAGAGGGIVGGAGQDRHGPRQQVDRHRGRVGGRGRPLVVGGDGLEDIGARAAARTRTPYTAPALTTRCLPPFWKDSTWATVPSKSEAVAETVTPAGAYCEVPSAGAVSVTVGGTFALGGCTRKFALAGPPPGAGLVTVTAGLPAPRMADAGTVT